MAVLGLMVGVLYLVIRPPDPETLYARAKKLMKSPKPEDHEKAYAETGRSRPTWPTTPAGRATRRTQMLAWKKQCDVEECEDGLAGLLKRHRKGFNSEPASDAEGQAKKAALAEEAGDLAEAQRLWQDMTQKYGPDSGQDLGRPGGQPPGRGAGHSGARKGVAGQVQGVPRHRPRAGVGRDGQGSVHGPARTSSSAIMSARRLQPFRRHEGEDPPRNRTCTSGKCSRRGSARS